MRLSACTIDLTTRRVAGLGDPRLSTLEARLLAFFAERPGQTIGREDLLHSVWGYASEVSYRAVDVAVHRLRQKIEGDPSAPVHLITIQGEGYVFVPLRAPDAAPALRRPRMRPGFVDRTRELQALGGWLTGGARGLLLNGPPGGGKSRLAQEFLARCSSHAAIQADLGAITSLPDLFALLSTQEGAETALARDGADHLARTGRALAARGPCVLLFDNADLLLEELADPLSAWFEAAPDLRILLTSRVVLPLPEVEHLALTPLSASASEELLRLRLIDAGANPDGTPLGPLVEALDGLPLALELAAARAPVMEIGDIVDHLGDRFRLLRQTGSGLREAIGWSIDRLEPGARTALSQLTVIQGSFGLDDVAGIADTPDALDAITELASASLIERGAPDLTGRASWRILRSVAELAAERLEPSTATAARDRHARWVADRVAALALHPSGELAIGTLRRLEPLAPDLLSAWQHARARDPAVAVDLALALDGWWTTRGSVAQRLELLDDALGLRTDARLLVARARAHECLGRIPAARRDLERALKLTDGGPASSLRAVAFHQRALLDELEGRPDAMMDSIDAACAEARAAGDRVFAAVADASWAIACRACGRPERTPEQLDAMFAAASETLEGAGGRRQAVNALVVRVRGLCHQGRWPLVRTIVPHALHLAEQEQLPFQRAHLEAQRALALEVAMDLDEALDAWQRSLELLRRLGRAAEAECVRSRRAWALHHLGRGGEARTECLAALHGREEAAGPLLSYYTGVCLAGLALEEGDPASSVRHCERTLPAVEEVFVAFGAHLRAVYALALARSGSTDRVAALIERSIVEVEQTQHGEAGAVVGTLSMRIGTIAEQPALVTRGESVLRALGPKRLEPVILERILSGDGLELPLSWLRL